MAAACALPGAALAQQQEAALPALRLKTTPMLSESLPASGAALPTFVRGARITGSSSHETAVEGDAELRKAGMTLRTARLQHDARHDIASTDSQVHLNHDGNRYRGSSARMQVDAHEAVVHKPSYQLLANGGHGTAQRLDMQDTGYVTIWGGTYTTCQCEDENGKPDWILRAKKLELDHEEGVGRAKDAVLEFKSFPLLPLPSMSFPLNSERRSGLLAPTIELDNKGGLSFLQPYYFNIAPNRDATLWPHLMLRRGLDLGGQFRYLERNYRGRINAHYMPNDRLRGRDRWGVFARHNATLHTGIGPVGAYL
ncbi:MAG: LPS-assembly protein LptD, partial [Ottowia sp.]|nr:LPS-assembly protein LptD [Ottowia sp.]